MFCYAFISLTSCRMLITLVSSWQLHKSTLEKRNEVFRGRRMERTEGKRQWRTISALCHASELQNVYIKSWTATDIELLKQRDSDIQLHLRSRSHSFLICCKFFPVLLVFVSGQCCGVWVLLSLANIYTKKFSEDMQVSDVCHKWHPFVPWIEIKYYI